MTLSGSIYAPLSLAEYDAFAYGRSCPSPGCPGPVSIDGELLRCAMCGPVAHRDRQESRGT